MKQGGFTLIEVLVVIGISAVLLTMATLNFNQMMRKSAIERQVKLIYTDLMGIRVEAKFQKQARLVGLNSNQVSLYSTDLDTSSVVQKPLSYPIEWGGGSQILFDTQGLANAPVGDKSICMQGDNPAAYDSIVISKARIQMGKKRIGGGCTSGNIDIQ